jgi:hypothetical protein
MAAMEAMQAEHVEGVENDAASLGPLPLGVLEAHGCAASDLKKLLENGIHTVQGLVAAPLKKLVLIKGLSEVKAKKLKDAGAPAARRGRGGGRGADAPCPGSQESRSGRVHHRHGHRAQAAEHRLHHHRLRGPGHAPARREGAKQLPRSPFHGDTP